MPAYREQMGCGVAPAPASRFTAGALQPAAVRGGFSDRGQAIPGRLSGGPTVRNTGNGVEPEHEATIGMLVDSPHDGLAGPLASG